MKMSLSISPRAKSASRLIGYAAILASLSCPLDASPAIGQTLTTIASINGTTNGAGPQGGVTFDAAGNLYGTTSMGGPSGNGAVFEVVKGSNTVTTLASFNSANGAGPQAGVTFDTAGNLYGTTAGGGANGQGTVFEIANGSSIITTLASFNGTNGSTPFGGVTFDTAGNLYGTTGAGGVNSLGTVFEIANGSNTVTTLASFNGSGSNGSSPSAGVTIDAAGNLYGTTPFGGDFGGGTVFEVAKGSNTITTLASFNGANGVMPLAGVTIDGAGNLYGTTQQGGANSLGTVFEIANGSNTITTLASFDGANGQYPVAGLTFDSAGNLYGTTSGGGDYGGGTVFELSLSAVPEPASLLLLGLGSASLVCRSAWRRRAERIAHTGP